MENDTFFIILEKCYKKGLFDTVDITPEFRQMLGKPEMVVNWRETPDMLLSEFKNLGYIHYIVFINSSEDVIDVPANWIDLINVSALLKPEGLLFYNSWLQTKTQQRANKLSTRNIIVTAIMAFCGLILGIITIVKTFIDSDYKQQIKVLQEQTQVLEKHTEKARITTNPKQGRSDQSHKQ